MLLNAVEVYGPPEMVPRGVVKIGNEDDPRRDARFPVTLSAVPDGLKVIPLPPFTVIGVIVGEAAT